MKFVSPIRNLARSDLGWPDHFSNDTWEIQMTRAVRRAFYAIAIALATVSILPAGAGAASFQTAPPPPTLGGEMFVAPFDFLSVNGKCNATGPSTFTFDASGPATGPNPGRFHETGSFTIASPAGPLTNFSAAFTIHSLLLADVVGTKGLVSSTGAAGCVPGGFFSDAHFLASTSYAVTAPFRETGTAPLTLDFRYPGTFREGPFTPTPAVQPGCDTNGQSNGDDQCNQ